MNEFLVEGIVMLLSADEFTVEQALLLVDCGWDWTLASGWEKFAAREERETKHTKGIL